MNGYKIRHLSRFEYKCTNRKGFNAVSKPKHLVNWWLLKCTGEPELGAKENFYFTPEYDWHGKVKEIILNQTFTIRMTKADLDRDD